MKQPQKPGQPSGPRRWLSILFYTLAFCILGFYFFGNKEGGGVSKQLSYTKLTSYIEAGAIDKIEVADDLQAKATVKPQKEGDDNTFFTDAQYPLYLDCSWTASMPIVRNKGRPRLM